MPVELNFPAQQGSYSVVLFETKASFEELFDPDKENLFSWSAFHPESENSGHHGRSCAIQETPNMSTILGPTNLQP